VTGLGALGGMKLPECDPKIINSPPIFVGSVWLAILIHH
jgi:hypothetical protein